MLKIPIPGRGPSPADFRNHLQIPKLKFPCKQEDTLSTYEWCEEDNELIRSCGILTSGLSIPKSLSTSDISTLNMNKIFRLWVSEEDIITRRNCQPDGFLTAACLEPMSRSYSTWVAVGGDNVSSSQLPSPQARLSSHDTPIITAADFIQSINKKVRQNYIRKRLLASHRLSKKVSKKNVVQVDAPETYSVRKISVDVGVCPKVNVMSSEVSQRSIVDLVAEDSQAAGQLPAISVSPSSLTTTDINRDRGRQLSRYERNMIIFNWLQTLEAGEDLGTGV